MVCPYNGILLINKMDELLIQTMAWMNLKSTLVSEKAELKSLYIVYFIDIQEKAKPHDQREQIRVARGWQVGNGGLTTNGHKQTFGDGGNTPSVCVDCCDYTWHLSTFRTLS